jgi:hypothetical protein
MRRREFMKDMVLTGGALLGASLPLSQAALAQGAGRKIWDLQPAARISRPRPRSFDDNMAARQPRWQVASPPEETYLLLETNDNAHRFGEKFRSGNLISMADPLFAGVTKQNGRFDKVDLYINNSAFVPRQAYILHEARWELVKAQGISNGQQARFTAQVEIGHDVQRTQTIITALGMAKWGKLQAQAEMETKISSLSESIRERTMVQVDREIYADEGQEAMYLLWVKADRFRVVDEDMTPFAFEARWVLHEGGGEANQAVFTCNPMSTTIRSSGETFDRWVFNLDEETSG